MMRAFAKTHRGYVRSENQDRFLANPTQHGWLVAVADGMGGPPGGAGASQRALEIIGGQIGVDRPHSAADLEQSVKAANLALFRWAHEEQGLAGMGTTLTVAQLTANELIVAHVGDSRAYRIRAGQLERLTRDHSVAAELEAAKQITATEAAHHPQRHVLTRAVGPWNSVRVDLLVVSWHAADRLLLCTDGLTGLMSDNEIMAMLLEHRGQAAVDALVSEALARGGVDNVTVVLVEDDDDKDSHHHDR